MAICTECGAVLHRDDIEDHVCDANDIPKKGEKHQPTYDKKLVKEVVKEVDVNDLQSGEVE